MSLSSILLISLFFTPNLVSFEETKHLNHGIYISVIEMNMIPLDTTATVKIKVFKDDLESALHNTFSKHSFNDLRAIYLEKQRFIETYFVKHFHCKINSQPSLLKLVDCQVESEVYWLYFTLNCPPKWQEFHLYADYFMELFPTQSNVLKLKYGEAQYFFRMTKDASNAGIQLEF